MRTFSKDPSKASSARLAFSLVELLVVITILMLLMSIVLFGMAGVQNTAHDRRARAQIMRLHQLIGDKMTTFENRRVRVQTEPGSYLANQGIAPNRPEARLLAIRELMRMELPDRITDVLDDPVVLDVSAVPGVARSYRRTYEDNLATGKTWSPQHQGAECLYMILARTYIGDSNGLQFFTEQELGDVDNDGMLEILDPWGNPVEFLRWAPGLTSPADPALAGLSTIQGNNPLEAWDPFDPMQVDGHVDAGAFFYRAENEPLFQTPPIEPTLGQRLSNFAMFPLIFSAGRDGKYNVAVGLKSSSGTLAPLHYNGQDQPSPEFANDPYATFSDGGNEIRLGQINDITSKGHLDNITNHFIEAQ